MMDSFPKETIDQNTQRLINQLWKLIPMRENDEDWSTHLKIVTEEIKGLIEICGDKSNGLILLSKLKGLASTEDFIIYKKTIFKCINLLEQVMGNE